MDQFGLDELLNQHPKLKVETAVILIVKMTANFEISYLELYSTYKYVSYQSGKLIKFHRTFIQITIFNSARKTM
jgi:hypothetical protein